MVSNYKNNKVLKNLVYLAYLTTGENAAHIYGIWDQHTVLKDYKKPSMIIIEEWISEFWEESK